MEVKEFIDKFEKRAEKIMNSVTREGTFRVISEKDWGKLKAEAMEEEEEPVQDDLDWTGYDDGDFSSGVME